MCRAAVMTETTECVQTGVRLEKFMLKVLRSSADQLNMSLGGLPEGTTLRCFESKVLGRYAVF